MIAIFVAVAAVTLGAFGPGFWWRGAAILLGITIGAGCFATRLAARDAQAAGLNFGFSLASIGTGLSAQIAVSIAFYVFGVCTRLLSVWFIGFVARMRVR